MNESILFWTALEVTASFFVNIYKRIMGFYNSWNVQKVGIFLAE